MTDLLPGRVTWADWGAIFTDGNVWAPVVHHVWEQASSLAALTGISRPLHIEPGFPGTCAVFVVDKTAVIKFFPPFLHHDFEREMSVLARLADRLPFLPRLLSAGVLSDRIDWPYLVMRYEPGVAWRDQAASVDRPNQLGIAAEMGRAIRLVHDGAVDCGPGPLSADSWPGLVEGRVAEAPAELRQHTRLPETIVRQAADLLQSTDWYHNAPGLVHADLTEDHILLERVNERWELACILDWADAEVAAPAYEWVALWFGFCRQDADLFRVVLSSYDASLVVDERFVERLLAYSLLHRFGPRIVGEVTTREQQKSLGSLPDLMAALFPGLLQ